MFRTRFSHDIVSEYLPPKDVYAYMNAVAQGKKATPPKQSPRKVVIIMKGAPSSPGSPELLEYFSRKGYWAFQPRYRGSWESGGVFLAKSHHYDVLDVIAGIEQGFEDSWSKQMVHIPIASIHLVGASFGGPAVLMASHHPLVEKVIALSPVVDWTHPSNSEPFEVMHAYAIRAFGNGYRWTKNVVEKLKKGTLYNPIRSSNLVVGEKVCIFHADDDTVVLSAPVKEFAKQIGMHMVTHKKGGHYGVSSLLEPRIVKRAEAFLGIR